MRVHFKAHSLREGFFFFPLILMKATAFAHINIALIKYWGKLSGSDNLPAIGSISLTVDGFGTQTTATFTDKQADTFTLNGKPQEGEPLMRVRHFLDYVRYRSKKTRFCHIDSQNHVPTKSGLASSASGFAALALACAKIFELPYENQTFLSQLARYGSASAARSIFGGFVYMHSGMDDASSFAQPLTAHSSLDVRLIVARCSDLEKQKSSREGMTHTAQTSPYYSSWLKSNAEDLSAATQALLGGNFEALGEVTEHSCLKMHAAMLAAKPGFWYINPCSMAVMETVKKLRQSGEKCYFTLDAGPHVKVLCLAGRAPWLAQQLQKVQQAVKVDILAPGPAAHFL